MIQPVQPGGFFFDTNVIVCSQDGSEPVEQQRARALMDAAMKSGRFVIGTQVLQEFYNVAVRKGWMPPAHALQLLRHLAEHPESARAPTRFCEPSRCNGSTACRSGTR